MGLYIIALVLLVYEAVANNTFSIDKVHNIMHACKSTTKLQ